MNKTELFVGDLFPISRPSAEIAFSIFDHNLEQAKKCAVLFERNTTTVKLWMKFVRGLAQVLPKKKRVNPTEISWVDSFELASKTFLENDPTLYYFLREQERALWEGWQNHVSLSAEEAAKIDRQNRRSYRYGIITGYTALLQEADLRRYGVLPAVPENILPTWHHDNIERAGKDFELFIDVVHGRGPEGMLESIKNLDKLNPYVSGYIGAFLDRNQH